MLLFQSVTLYLCLISPGVLAQRAISSPVLTPEVDAFINDLLSDWNSPGGVSVAVVRKAGNDTWDVETKGYGVAKADGTNVTAQTLFAIGSNSKVSPRPLALCTAAEIHLLEAIRCTGHWPAHC